MNETSQTGRPRPIPPEQPIGASDEENTSGNGADAKPRPRLFTAATIKQLFRKVAEAVTLKPPQVEQRRKSRQEETGKAFRMDLTIMRRAVRSIFHEPDYWKAPDYDEHAEHLRLLEMSEQEDFTQQDDNGAFHSAEGQYISLHL